MEFRRSLRRSGGSVFFDSTDVYSASSGEWTEVGTGVCKVGSMDTQVGEVRQPPHEVRRHLHVPFVYESGAKEGPQRHRVGQ